MRLTVVVLLLTIATSTAVRAQAVRGRVVDASSGDAISAAEVVLLVDGEAKLRAITDSTGFFHIAVPRPGRYALRVERLGYEAVSSEAFGIAADERVEVVARLGPRPIELEALEVTARRRVRHGRLEEFYRRAEFVERTGLGRIITREEIERRGALRTSDYLRTIPRVRVVSGGYSSDTRVVMRGACEPRLYVDGLRVYGAEVDDLVTPLDLEGIEIYRGAGEVPGELYDPDGCGAIVFWTRRGDNRGPPFTLTRMLVFLGVVAGAVFLTAR